MRISLGSFNFCTATVKVTFNTWWSTSPPMMYTLSLSRVSRTERTNSPKSMITFHDFQIRMVVVNVQGDISGSSFSIQRTRLNISAKISISSGSKMLRPPEQKYFPLIWPWISSVDNREKRFLLALGSIMESELAVSDSPPSIKRTWAHHFYSCTDHGLGYRARKQLWNCTAVEIYLNLI